MLMQPRGRKTKNFCKKLTRQKTNSINLSLLAKKTFIVGFIVERNRGGGGGRFHLKTSTQILLVNAGN